MKRIYLIDCPGVVPNNVGDSETDTVLKGVVRIENIKTPEDHIPTVLKRIKREHIAKTYNLRRWTDSTDFLEQLARASGRLLKGGGADLGTVSRMILTDWIRGKLPHFIEPPRPDNETVDVGTSDDKETEAKEIEALNQDAVEAMRNTLIKEEKEMQDKENREE